LFTTPGRVFGAAINPNPKKKQMEMDTYIQLKNIWKMKKTQDMENVTLIAI